MTAMVWLRALGLPLPIAVTYGLENTRGKSKERGRKCNFANLDGGL